MFAKLRTGLKSRHRHFRATLLLAVGPAFRIVNASMNPLFRRDWPPRGVRRWLGFIWLAGLPWTSLSALEATRLRTEYRDNPLGLDTRTPRLSWVLESGTRGAAQTGYQILAGSTAETLKNGQADLWDSGKVPNPESIQIPYAGKPLRSGQRVHWKVRVWDAAGQASAYSPAAWFETALLAPSDWRGQWITRPRPLPKDAFEEDPAPLFRKEFTIPPERTIKCARAYVSGLGYYELSLNGRKVGDHVLDPGWTTYSQRVLYSTYDITRELRSGTNALGIMLGNGWFNPLPLPMWGRLNLREHLTVGAPRAILQLVIAFTDGSSQTVVTDDSWRVADGPMLQNSVYLGETYDARRELPGWNQPGFDDSRWEPALQAELPQLGALQAQAAPPIRITRRLKPIKVSEPQPGVFIFDFGQNFAGCVRLATQGPAGTRVRLRYGELLYPDGTLNGMTAVCGQIKDGGKDYRHDGFAKPKTAFQQDTYVLRGTGPEAYTPRFTFHGFRYVEVTGFPGRPNLETLEGLRLNSEVQQAGTFACSNEMLNRIQNMVLWTELSNLFSVQSDCPHREKFGYGGDIVASSEMALLNFDMAQFYTKAAQDLADAVRPNGGFTETAPFVGISDESVAAGAGPIGWGTAQPLLLAQLRQYYGDMRLLTEQYDATRRWIALLQSRATNHVLDNGLSDHESLEPKPRALTGTGFYFFNVKLFAQLARALGKTDDAAAAEQLAGQIRSAFNQKFLKPGTGQFGAATQASQAFALYLGLAPAAEQPRALDVLTRNIVDAHQGHLATGIFGTKFLLNALTDAGRADVAHQIVNQRSFPGWGHMLDRGATTLWEHWEFSDNTYSHNHPMFGSVSEWLYKAVGGIAPAPDAVGFNRILIRPQPVGDLTWAKASYDSIRGPVTSEWRREGPDFQLKLRLPIGAEGTVVLPAADVASIQENQKPLSEVRGVQLLQATNQTVVLRVNSGAYHFTSRLN